MIYVKILNAFTYKNTRFGVGECKLGDSYQSAVESWVGRGDAVMMNQSEINAYEDLNAPANQSQYSFGIAITDEETPIETGGVNMIFHASRSFKLNEVFAGLSINSSAGAVAVIIKKNDAEIFGDNKLVIDEDQETSLVSADQPDLLPDQINFVKGDRIEVEITDAGADAAGLKLYFNGVET